MASTQSTTDVSEIEEDPKEVILKKVTLATFYCDLKSINWSDSTMDFYWADHPDIGERAIRINGSLRVIMMLV